MAATYRRRNWTSKPILVQFNAREIDKFAQFRREASDKVIACKMKLHQCLAFCDSCWDITCEIV
uniref:Uncharacterized protein n=1 Tax=Rhizophora mucronata TaxID=61149 RepID=A0A2P2QLK0_RHIMU